MACDTINVKEQEKRRAKEALDALKARLKDGTASVVIDARTGAVAFKGWEGASRGFWSDACAYRRLAQENDPALRRAVAAAEARAGRKVDPRAVASGVHSHDGGATWGPGH